MLCDVRGKREWTGDWSQKSDKWSDSVRAELGWSEKNDGTFWMTWQGEQAPDYVCAPFGLFFCCCDFG